MAKFFVDKQAIEKDCIYIKGSDVNHIKNVLRLCENKEILINDRQGNDYKCIINKMNADMVCAKILQTIRCETEPSVETVLYQSLIKGEKMEFVIQKCIEIGVTKIVPMNTERCVVKIESEKKMQTKIDRWNKIAESAAKQSKRGLVPEVMMPVSFKDAVKSAQENCTISCIPYENEQVNSIKSFLKASSYQSIGIFIGPEGGFTEGEIALAKQENIQSVSLGKRILRSETAGMVVLANIMYEVGGI